MTGSDGEVEIRNTEVGISKVFKEYAKLRSQGSFNFLISNFLFKLLSPQNILGQFFS